MAELPAPIPPFGVGDIGIKTRATAMRALGRRALDYRPGNRGFLTRV
jgi:hypothetical protein